MDQSISVDEYIKTLNLFYPVGLSINIQDVQLGEIKFKSNSTYQINATLIKYISGLCSYEENYVDSFELNLTIGFSKDSATFNNFIIKNIESKSIGRFFTFVFEKNNGKKLKKFPVYLNRNKYVTNVEGEIFLENLSIEKNTNVTVNKPDYFIVNENSFDLDKIIEDNLKNFSGDVDPNKNKLIVKKRNSDFKLSFAPFIPYTNGFGFEKALKVPDGSHDLKFRNRFSYGYQIGFEAGHRIIDKEKFDIYIRTGIKYNASKSSVVISHDKNQYFTSSSDTINLFRFNSRLNVYDIPLSVELISSGRKFDVVAKLGLNFSMYDKGSYKIKGEYVNGENSLGASKIDPKETKSNIKYNLDSNVNINLFVGIEKKLNETNSVFFGPNIYFGNAVAGDYPITSYSNRIDDLSLIQKHFNKIKIRSMMLEVGFRRKFSL